MSIGKEHGDYIEVSIRHPDGIPLLLTESLARYLVNRPHKYLPFYLGHWLSSLNDADLNKLVEFSERTVMNLMSDNPVSFDGQADVLGVIINTLAGETRSDTVSMDPVRHIGGLYYCAAMEECRRAGWMRLSGELSLANPDQCSAYVTDKGQAEMPEYVKRFTH